MTNRVKVNDHFKQEFSFFERETNAVGVPEIQSLVDQAVSNLNEQLKHTSVPEQQEAIADRLKMIQGLKPLQVTAKLKTGTEYESRQYYVLPNAKASGVTEKTCLINIEKLKLSLEGVVAAKDYKAVMQADFGMTAFLKHPKHGEVKEVQREALALKIARMLDFKHVTESTIVYHHNGRIKVPCLLIPFDDMNLLEHYIDRPETNKATIRESEIQPEDFGKYVAFFMLCSDPDFIGKKGGNKGIIEDKLYIFDQVFMTDSHFALDRAFNLVPTALMAKLPIVSRHSIGRNRSVVNDSDFEEKIKGTVHLLKKKEGLKELFISVEAAHKGRTDYVSQTLKKDAKQCLKAFNKRIKNMEKLFPKMVIEGNSNTTYMISDLINNKNEDKLNLLTKAMLLTQVVNKTRSENSKGLKYRTPFFSYPSTYVKKVTCCSDGTVAIEFNRFFGPPLSKNKQDILKSKGFSVSPDGKTAKISQDQLLQLDPSKNNRVSTVYKEQVQGLKAGADVNKVEDHELGNKNQLRS